MSTNRYIDKLKVRLAKEADQRMQLQALLDDQVSRNRALLAERDRMREALDEIVGLCRALRQGGPDPMDLEDLSNALEQAVDLSHAALQGAQP